MAWPTCRRGVPRTSTLGLTNATFPYAKRWLERLEEGLPGRSGLVPRPQRASKAKVVYPAVAETFGLPSTDPKSLV